LSTSFPKKGNCLNTGYIWDLPFPEVFFEMESLLDIDSNGNPKWKVRNPLLRFLPNVCDVCKKASFTVVYLTIQVEAKKCARCKSVWYCGRDHQKLDWNNHKEFCKIVNEFLPLPSPKVKNQRGWIDCNTELCSLLKIELMRELSPHEQKVIRHRYVIEEKIC
jgi:hypothetical protein